jgi:hypothetical protein
MEQLQLQLSTRIKNYQNDLNPQIKYFWFHDFAWLYTGKDIDPIERLKGTLLV